MAEPDRDKLCQESNGLENDQLGGVVRTDERHSEEYDRALSDVSEEEQQVWVLLSAMVFWSLAMSISESSQRREVSHDSSVFRGSSAILNGSN